ncbi:hypothetical protein ACQ7CU_04815 [Chryseobacterium arthrosphaerae]|uniref:hypothetical protein n=1 Tax=Chryseobacterium arthrosphaerae TaxID=651561 RepID=UPI003D352074
MGEELNKEIIRQYNQINKQQHLRISDKYSKRATSLKLIIIDLHTILECLDRIRQTEKQDEIILNSLWNNLIVTYGKIFTKSKNGFTSLVKNQIIKSEYEKIHDELIDLRNKFVAHREDNEIENALLLISEYRNNGNVAFAYHLPVVMQTSSPIKDLELLYNLINDLEKTINEKIYENLKKIDDKLWEEIREIRRRNQISKNE